MPTQSHARRFHHQRGRDRRGRCMGAGGLPHTMTSERGNEERRVEYAEQRQRRGPNESVSLNVKRAFPYGLYGRR
jgi:hypothetical protein